MRQLGCGAGVKWIDIANRDSCSKPLFSTAVVKRPQQSVKGYRLRRRRELAVGLRAAACIASFACASRIAKAAKGNERMRTVRGEVETYHAPSCRSSTVKRLLTLRSRQRTDRFGGAGLWPIGRRSGRRNSIRQPETT